MNRAALIGAVEFNAPHFQAQDFDLVIAVDRGYQTCLDQGIQPDIVLGDFDSLGYVPQANNVKVHPSIKDESDMEIALRLAHARGYREVYVYGALAARVDHTIANLQLFGAFATQGMRVIGVGTNFITVALAGGNVHPSSVVFAPFEPTELTGEYGPYISVFAVGGRAEGVSESGLKYEVENITISGASSLGLSNEFVGKAAEISIRKGSLLLIFALDAWQYMSWNA